MLIKDATSPVFKASIVKLKTFRRFVMMRSKSKKNRAVNTQLEKRPAQFPESCPQAPESEELGRDMRQLVIDRYRVLFAAQSETGSIL
jgi:hypothetical protein